MGSAPLVRFIAPGLVAATCMFALLFDDIRLRSNAQNVRGVRLRDESDGNPYPDASADDAVPACARDVFFVLRRDGGDGEEHRPGGNSTCIGLLIRDDMVLTSRECSALSLEFDHPFDGAGTLRASPHAFRSKNEQLIDPRLGFLEADPPWHYRFAGKPTRRTRVFLSRRSEVGGASVAVTCNGSKPVAHGFPVDGQIVPLGHLAGALPKDILWEDADIDTAPALEQKSDRWWTKAVTLHKATKPFKGMLKSKGPPWSLSIHTNGPKSFRSRVSFLCEAVDPRGHRRPDCFKDYLEEWMEERPFSNAHFFDWLDFVRREFSPESRKHSKKCSKKNFDGQTAHYFSDEERNAHEVYMTSSEDGEGVIARYKLTDWPVRPSDPDHPHLYMWDLNEKFYVVDDTWDKEKYGPIKHSGLLAGRPALCAGKVYFGDGGAMTGINFSSGHYRPGILAISIMYRWMQDRGLDVTGFNWIGREMWSVDLCKKYNWDDVKNPEYNSTALNQSCHEVTTGPTWILKEDVRTK